VTVFESAALLKPMFPAPIFLAAPGSRPARRGGEREASASCQGSYQQERSMFSSFQAAGSLFPELMRLQQQLEEFFQPAGVAGIRSPAGGAFPAVNVGSTPESVEVIAFAPGIDPKDMEITVDRGLLTLSGERRDTSQGQQDPQASNVYSQERFTGKFRRVLSLPEDADPQKVEAKFSDGVLHVTVAKKVSSRPRRISVS
jgi:HSP20 family protein